MKEMHSTNSALVPGVGVRGGGAGVPSERSHPSIEGRERSRTTPDTNFRATHIHMDIHLHTQWCPYVHELTHHTQIHK